MKAQDMEGTLRRLLDQNAAFAWGARGTSNHCPMALVALARMGASPARLQAFFDHWTQRFAIRETQPATLIAKGDWRAHIGLRPAFSSLQKHFSEWITAAGFPTVIHQVLRQTPFAPATGAYHALIRLGYGLEAGHVGEMAAGLAVYVASNLPICVAGGERKAATSVKDGLAVLSQQLAGRSWHGNSITDRLATVAADNDFKNALQPPPKGPIFLDDLARAAVELYCQTEDFTVLHLVTGTYAERTVLKVLPAELAERMRPSIWAAFCAAYVSVGAPALDSVAPAAVSMGWNEAMRRAVDSDDEHVIKMVYTCFNENKRDPDAPYLQAALAVLAPKHR